MGLSRRISALGAVALSAVLALAGCAREAATAESSVLPFAGTGEIMNGSVAPIGALLDGQGDHFCTAAVVHSPPGNVAVTAAHCVDDTSDPIFFVPGYLDGDRPFGTWQVVSTVVAPQWTAEGDEDLDVAFLVLADTTSDRPIERVTGGYELVTDPDYAQWVRLTGYPNELDVPITCANTADQFGDQQRIDCTDFSDGTSGSPWLADGAIVGVIGGYEEGGDTADVSYSPYFGSAVADLYLQAIGAPPLP